MNTLYQIIQPCIFHKVTGLYCPGCGGTRAVYALLTGHILRSFYYHPIVLYTVVCLLWYFLKKFVQKVTKGKYTVPMPGYKMLLHAALGIVLINCLLRNVLYMGWNIAL